MTAILCIGGLDPSGRAGLLADARAAEAMGVRALCVATALTYQSSRRATGYEPVPAHIVARQVRLLLEDEPVAAVKLGQLATPDVAAALLPLLGHLPLVVDTPLATSSGAPLFPPERVREAYGPLLARATLATPNAVEVFALAGVDPSGDPEGAARRLEASAVLLKGGHRPGDVAEDLLLTADGGRRGFSAPRVDGSFRGTGCRLASAIAARLALGDPLEQAVGRAKFWLYGELERDGSH